jgi:serine/threonine-protein kinase HipA
MNIPVIEVRIWGQRVGAVAADPRLGCYVFAYEPAWRRSGIELAPLTMPLADTSTTFAFPNLAEPSYHIRVGTSAGGARAKAVVTWNPQTNEICSGQFEAAEGFQHWVLKFDGMGKDLELGGSADYGRIEYAYHLMAKAAGIHMSDCRLLEESGRAHFMTRRFDREINEHHTLKHHVQTLCALNHMDYKQRATHAYAQLFMVIAKLKLGDEANTQAFRRMVFNVMAKNCDDHSKNFAFSLKQGGAWELAPAYDLTHAHNPKGEWTYQHLMSVNGKFNNITRADLLQEADRFGMRRPLDLIADVKVALESWSKFSAEAGLGVKAVEEIAAEFEKI